MKRRALFWIGSAALLTVAAIVLFGLKIISVTPYFAEKYSVQGVDVSHYQGDIDWEILASQGIEFAYIKATEGSSYVDEKFVANWRGAGQTSLYTGAYHFFSFDSPAKTQAENYIRTVGDLSGRLIPVVDVEYYGDKEANPPKKEDVTAQLKELLQLLEERYQVKPMIYTTYKVYGKYIEGEFDEYPLWIRNVYFVPQDKPVSGGGVRCWQFWQYSDRGILEGYQGQEKYIDLNVFRGDAEELNEFLVP